MSRLITENTTTKYLFCGYTLNSKEQAILLDLTRSEFDKKVNERRSESVLVKEARDLYKYNIKHR
jgi:hypothetical protein